MLRGVTRADRLNPHEPTPPDGEVVKPGGLSMGARQVWDELAPICLAMGTLTVADVRPFAMLCELQATLQHAATLKDDADTVAGAIKLERSYAPVIRPYYALFGLEPVSRARIQVPKGKAQRPASKWADVLA